MKINPSVSLSVFLTALIYTFFAGRFLDPLFRNWAGPFFSLGLAFIPLLAAFFLRSNIKNVFSLKIPEPRQTVGGLVLSAGLFLSVLFVSVFISVFFPGMPVSGKNIGTNVLDQNICRLVLSIVVMPAISEELLFRGFILSGFATTMKKMNSIILCALLFALLHLEPFQIPFAFLVGIGLSWVALETGSVWISVLMHAFHNLALLLIVRGIASRGFEFSTAMELTQTTSIVLAGACGLGTVLVSFILIRLGISLVSCTSRCFPVNENSLE